MIKNNSFKEIWDKIKASKRIGMTLHYGPDGDSLASCTAMKYVIEKYLRKTVEIISEDNPGEGLISLWITKEIDFTKGITTVNPKDFDLFLIIDCASYNMIYGKEVEQSTVDRFFKNVFTINIDHHLNNPHFCNMTYVDDKAQSTASILLEMFKSLKITFDKELSSRLILGITTDSGFFTYGGGESSFGDAAFLIKHGAEYVDRIVNPLKNNTPLRIKQYHALLIQNFRLKKIKDKNIGYSFITSNNLKKFRINHSELRQSTSTLAEVKEAYFVFMLTELADQVRCAFRSRKGVDVSVFARALGGGGHKSAAACILPKIPLKEANNMVLSMLRKKL